MQGPDDGPPLDRRSFQATRWGTEHGFVVVGDEIAVEEPLEIRLTTVPVAVVMRSPGRDLDLAVGFLFGEGILRDPSDLISVETCRDEGGEPTPNIVTVRARGADPKAMERARREIYASSSCGICGKSTLEAIRLIAPAATPTPAMTVAVVAELTDQLRKGQVLFAQTGAVHGAALVDRRGQVLDLAEDVGRHNAVDKIVGAAVRSNTWPLAGLALVLSGRVSFELVQKAAMSGASALIAVSAPTSLAVELAREHGLTLIGFARDGRFTVYSGALSP